MTGPEHGSASTIEILPVIGLPEFRPGDDLSAAVAAAAPWLRDGDVVVVTSKVVSKCEGRLVPAPEDPEQRDRLRRKLIEDEAVRVLARKDRTLITENRLGLVQAAAGVDGSNVGRSELALLPVDPDASAATLRAGLRERLGVTVAVVITDTMGRAWRNGQTDAAVGAAGLAVLRNYAGVRDPYGNELVVTEVAVADEIAAAADLVKGKLTATPVAVVRGFGVSDDGSTARQLLRPGAGSGPPKRSSWVASKPNCCAGPFAGLAPIRCRATSSRLRSPRPSPRQPHITPGRPDSCGCRHRPSARGC